MKFSANSHIEYDINIIMSAIRAVEKAITEDIPREQKERHLETNNYIAFIRGDYINQNLKDFALVEGGELLAFKRYGWKGRLLIDRENKLSYSITSQSNLQQIPRKHRTRPHFLQTLLNKENGDLEGRYQQMAMYDMDQFDSDTYDYDFEDIVGGAFDPSEGYRHCVIAYQSVRDELIDIKLVLLDGMFNIVEEHSLNHLRKPDFSQLTYSTPAQDTAVQEHNRATRGLTSLKPGIKPGLWEEEEEA